jgi:hypothetical protein
MCPTNVSHPPLLSGKAPFVSTYKSDEMIYKNQHKANNGKVEPKSIVGQSRIRRLKVQNHNAGGNQVRENETAEEDESVLRDAVPWRMTGAKENRLQVFQRALSTVSSALLD